MICVGLYAPLYRLISEFLCSHGTLSHVMVMEVGEVEETWRSAGGEDGAACSKTIRHYNNMQVTLQCQMQDSGKGVPNKKTHPLLI